MLKKSLSIIIVLCMILGCFSVMGTAFAAEADYQLTGDDGYTEISTVEDLYTINTNLSGSYRLMNDIDLIVDKAFLDVSELNNGTVSDADSNRITHKRE